MLCPEVIENVVWGPFADACQDIQQFSYELLKKQVHARR